MAGRSNLASLSSSGPWGGGRVISVVRNTYSTTTGERQTMLLQSVVTEAYDGTAAACTVWAALPCSHGRRTKVEYTYDNYGNVTRAGGIASSLAFSMGPRNDGGCFSHTVCRRCRAALG